MNAVEISVERVCSVLRSLDAGSAMGPDEVHPRLLRECAAYLASPLQQIFSRSLESRVLPDVWKSSIVLPLFKSKSRYDSANYRHVSLTSVCCKAMERILTAELMHYLEANNILSDRQFSFQKGRSTEDQILLEYSEVVK